jgi:cytoskeletal protein RodZ
LTIHDVERDTRISAKYLEALEAGRLDVLPAPVYARAFMRTYAQYLGLNAAQLVQQMPGARPEPELPPLPEVSRAATGTPVSASWLVAGVVVVLLFAFGLLLFWNRGGGADERVTQPPPGAGAEQPTAQASATPAPVDTIPGVVPDLEEQHILVAINALADAELPYLIIELERDGVEEGTVFAQSPTSGTVADDATVVTLLVSR